MNLKKYGYYSITSHSPKVFLGNPMKNAKNIVKVIKKDSFINLYPELILGGYSVEDLHLNLEYLEEIREALVYLKKESVKLNTIIVVGAALSFDDKLFNCGVVIFKGEIKAVIPKSYLPNYNEFYEKRWFSEGKGLDLDIKDKDLGEFKVAPNQIIKVGDCKFAIEICEDIWSPIPPSINYTQAGAQIILNLSASPNWLGKSKKRNDLIKVFSEQQICAYIYASSGPMESTKDLLYSGELLSYENGSLLKKDFSIQYENKKMTTEVDIQRIKAARIRNKTWNLSSYKKSNTVELNMNYSLNKIDRSYNKLPFVPKEVDLRNRSLEVLEIQESALIRRLLSIKSKKIVIGISGGLDSTLAYIVAVRAFMRMKWDLRNIIAISMPGMGTSDQTLEITKNLAKLFKTSFEIIPIKEDSQSQLGLLNHKKVDITYENVQARLRTAILFNKANQKNALVLGTGDLSEIALGWSTFNGDHISGYNVNSSIPKTLVKFLVNFARQEFSKEISEELNKVLDLKISPELLPIDNLNIQDTEEKLGPYILHDFFLFHFINNQFSKEKILFLAKQTFKKDFNLRLIKKTLDIFMDRFYKNQFKRSCFSSGIKVGSVSLSPRGDFRLADEIER